MRNFKTLTLIVLLIALLTGASFAESEAVPPTEQTNEMDVTEQTETPTYSLSIQTNLPEGLISQVTLQSANGSQMIELIPGTNNFVLPEGSYEIVYSAIEGYDIPEAQVVLLYQDTTLVTEYLAQELTNSESLDPETTEPAITDPETTEPAITDPETTEPAITDPETTEPAITDPETSEVAVSETESKESDQDKQEQKVTTTSVTESMIQPLAVGDTVNVQIIDIPYYDATTPAHIHVADASIGFGTGLWLNQGFGKFLDTATGMIGFCLNPFEAGPNGTNYPKDYFTKYTTAMRKEAEIIAVNGYYLGGINGYTDDQNFIFTQRRLWEILPVESPFTGDNARAVLRFATGDWSAPNPALDTIYQSWLGSLNQKIANYSVVPSFSGQAINLKVGQSITLTDTNGVLSQYRFGTAPTGISYTISGNTITLTATGPITGKLDFVRNLQNYEGVGYITEKPGTDPATGLPYQDLGFFRDRDPARGSLSITASIPIGNVTLTKTQTGTTMQVAGATYAISTSNTMTNPISTATTNSSGQISWTGLEVGTYYVKETQAPTGYVLDPTVYTVTVTDGQTSALNVQDRLIAGTPTITKVDISTEAPLPNTVIELYDENDNLIETKTTDENGFAEFEKVTYGKYYFLEKEAPEGYLLNPDKHWFEIRTDGEVVHSTMSDEMITGTPTITKVDISTEAPLPNTVIELYDENDNLIETKTTDENGFAEFKKVTYGKYYFLEKEAPEGYLLNPDKHWFEIRTDGEVVHSTMSDEMITGTPTITKVDISTEAPLPNTVIELYDENDNLIETKTTDENGFAEFEKVTYGKYYFLEKDAPEGYLLNPDKHWFEIRNDGEVIHSTMTNEMIRGDFGAVKTDAETEEPVPGATYTIYRDGKIVAELVTDEEGKIHINLPYGRYTMKETKAPEGYTLDPEEYAFEIKEHGKLIFQALVEEPIYSVVEITKQDSKNLKAVPGATIVFYNEAGEEVFKGVTDENGKIRVRLRYGNYTYKETIAPAGYILAEKIGKISITEDGVTIEEVFYNEPIPTLPNTGMGSNLFLIYLGIITLAISLILMIKRPANERK